jgi:hypothetical protein
MSLETLTEENRGAIEAETASAKAVFSVEGGLVGLTALPGAGSVQQTQRRCSAGSRPRCDRPMGAPASLTWARAADRVGKRLSV